jgi:DNA repair protein RecO (recombination protein O)
VSGRPPRLARTSHQGLALLLRVVPYQDADAVVTMLVEPLGRVSAMARGARRMKRSSSLVLEPMHVLSVQLDERPSSELMTLRESRLERIRPRLTSSLDALEAAGQMLRWARDLAPPRQPEPALWAEVNALLDSLDIPGRALAPRVMLAASGLRLLRALGYGFELSACIRCGKPCPEQAPAYLDASAGGLVCTGCGGASYLLRPDLRKRARSALDGEDSALEVESAEAVLGWIDKALAAHAGLAPADAG